MKSSIPLAEEFLPLPRPTLVADLPSLLRLVAATVALQTRLFLRNTQEWTRAVMMPLQALVAMAILVHSGRTDLAGYALTASLLFTIGDMGFFVGSEIVAGERWQQILELLVAAPSPYFLTLLTRTLLVALLGLVGFVEGWLIARLVFGISISIYHPWILTAALLATVFAAGTTAVLTAALFTLAKTTRTLQNAFNGPLYLLGGVLVPVSFLPAWLQPVSPFVFFYWSASLVRDAFAAPPVENFLLRLSALLGLGLLGGLIGSLILGRMLNRLRQSGRLGLA